MLRLHVEREQALAGGFDCVHHKLMKVREMDAEENIWRVRVECRRLKGVKKIQFHLRKMNLKSYIAEKLTSPTTPATKEAAVTCPRKDIGGAVGYDSLKPTVVAAVLSRSAEGVAHPFPHRTERQRHEGICSLYGADTRAVVSYFAIR